jgi:hypothetical protein
MLVQRRNRSTIKIDGSKRLRLGVLIGVAGDQVVPDMTFPRFLILVLIIPILNTLPANIQIADQIVGEEGQLAAELYEMIEFDIPVDPELYDNPFDAADIEVLGIFRSPAGEDVVVTGFWMQPYEDRCQPPCVVEDLQPSGDPVWLVRFAPGETGSWSYQLQVREDGAILWSDAGEFVVTESAHRGFIRLGANRRYFAHDDGTPYFPIGHNMHWSWSGGGGVVAYVDWLRQLSENGGNYARLYIDIPWFIGLEWQRPVGDYRAGQEAAARLDTILDAAAEYGVSLQLVLLWHQALTFYSGPPVLIPETFPRPRTAIDWDENPYNTFNGGPLSGPGVFFINEQARELFQRRLQYIVARWGHHPHIFAWELVDEIDRVVNYDPVIADRWLQDMVSYLRQIDPYQHLITAGSRGNDPVIIANPLLDFSASRFYQRLPIETVAEQVPGVLAVIRGNLSLTSSPTLLTGYSLNPWFEPLESDPAGVHFQNTLWAAALSGSSGGAISDYWYTYVIPQNLQRYYPPLAGFVEGIDWGTLDLRPAEAGLEIAPGSADAVRIDGFRREFRGAQSDAPLLTITPDGVFPAIENVSAYLYGQVYSSQFSQPQTYRVAVPVETWMDIAVRSVSGDAGARLQVVVNDRLYTELALEPGSRGAVVRVNLPVGEHTITLLNTGEDWLQLDYIEVADLFVPLRVLTLRDDDAGLALSWLQHRSYTWENVAAGETWEPVRAIYRLAGMPPGRYLVEIWDPLRGMVLGEEIARVSVDGVLEIELLPVSDQLALRAFLQREGENS